MYIFLEVAPNALGVGIAEESHLEGIWFRENADEDAFVGAETFHCAAEGLCVDAGIADCCCARIVAGGGECWRAISGLLRRVLSLRRELALRRKLALRRN